MTADAPTPGEFEVELASGRYFDVTAPDHRALTLDDIAVPLGKTCRYGGACSGFYSVAEHAVLVASKLRRLGAPLELQFAGLHHDDAEFCLSDIQRPVKLAKRSLVASTLVPDDPDKHLTKLIDRAVWRALAWPVKEHPPLWRTEDLHDDLVKRVDVWVCAFEARHIMPSRGVNWEQTWLLGQDTQPIPEHDDDSVECLDWHHAAARFTHYHALLVDEARQRNERAAAMEAAW